ncbi:NAD-dependent succinate-semialdehyde dehydrogenase [Asticcacaulis endophyticus]|nr:NAD-dependent succinate-semialdehyde dehydrogenase [Asticcacaulis endophyticus]
MSIEGLKRADLLRQQALIGGVWCDADAGMVINVDDPASLATIATVPDMGAGEAERAVTAAHAALSDWSALPAKTRAKLLRNWFDLIETHAEDIALILTREQGKPYAEAIGEIAYAAGFIEWFAEEAKRISGDTLPAPRSDQRLMVIKQPVGVVAAITPWNFPAAMITRKAGAALAAGCTVVLKPSDLTPLTALALAVLAQEAGIPDGVFNVVTGQPQGIGSVLTGDPRVRKLTFTGSTAVGKFLTAACAGTMKRVSMELGGNAALIVFDDADLDVAVEGAMASKFRNTGQTCVCANRILVQDGIYDRFVAALKLKVDALKVATGLTYGATQGPLINKAALDKVERHVADAVSKGAQVITGGHALNDIGAGAFFAPTILTNATTAMALSQEETFGPVAPIFRFYNASEAVAMANAVSTGLAAYVFTRDLSQALVVSEGLETGMVGLNTGAISTEMAPFGGIKDSGLGREGSKYGIEEYLDIKFMLIGGVSAL